MERQAEREGKMQPRGRGKQVGSLSGAGKRGGVGGLQAAKKSRVGIVDQVSEGEYSHRSQFQTAKGLTTGLPS